MLREMSFRRFQEWRAYFALEPVGDQRADWQAASICRAIFDSLAIKAGSRKRFRTEDFLLEFTDEPKEEVSDRQTWQEQKMIAMMFFAQSNAGKNKRK